MLKQGSLRIHHSITHEFFYISKHFRFGYSYLNGPLFELFTFEVTLTYEMYMATSDIVQMAF